MQIYIIIQQTLFLNNHDTTNLTFFSNAKSDLGIQDSRHRAMFQKQGTVNDLL